MFFLGSMAKGYNALIQVILMLTTPAHTSTVWHLDFHVFLSDALLLIMSSILTLSLIFILRIIGLLIYVPKQQLVKAHLRFFVGCIYFH